MGSFLLTVGGPFRNWFDESVFHEAWNNMLITLTDGRIGEVETLNLETEAVLENIPQWLGPYVFILLLTIPIILYFYKNGQNLQNLKQNLLNVLNPLFYSYIRKV